MIDAVKVPRSARAGLKIAVALAEDGVIPREEAVLRVEPRALSELLHRQVDPRSPRDVVCAASPPAPVLPRDGSCFLRPMRRPARLVASLHPCPPRNRARGHPRDAFGSRRAD